jgi:hypothetical protein
MASTHAQVQSSTSQTASSNIAYDLALVLFRGIINVFFREVRPRGSFNIPRDGPVIFVGAPHSNQVRLLSLEWIRCYVEPTRPHSSSIFSLHCRSTASQGDALLSWSLLRV